MALPTPIGIMPGPAMNPPQNIYFVAAALYQFAIQQIVQYRPLQFHHTPLMGFISQMFCCLRSRPTPDAPQEKPVDPEQIAANVVAILHQAEDGGAKITRSLNDAVSSTGWSKRLANSILQALETTLREGCEKMGPAMARSYDDAGAAAKDNFCLLCELAQSHPREEPGVVLATVIALGVLVDLAPVVVELLGFGAFGPVEGRSHSV